MSSGQKQSVPGKGWIHRLRLPKVAFNDEVSFDPEQLPLKLMDRRTLVVGKVLIGITIFECFMGSVIWWESKASHAYLRTEGIPGEAWFFFILTVLTAAAAAWLILRFDEIEITGQHVRVREHRPIGGREWTAAIKSYRGIEAWSQEFREGDTMDVWTTCTLTLVHDDATRDLGLRSVRYNDGNPTDECGRPTLDSESFEKENIVLGKRWAHTMGLPLIIRRDEELNDHSNNKRKGRLVNTLIHLCFWGTLLLMIGGFYAMHVKSRPVLKEYIERMDSPDTQWYMEVKVQATVRSIEPFPFGVGEDVENMRMVIEDNGAVLGVIYTRKSNKYQPKVGDRVWVNVDHQEYGHGYIYKATKIKPVK